MSQRLESKINLWKNKLLDLGIKNRLLNLKELKRSTIKIKKPDMINLWTSFVEKEKPIKFPYVEEKFDNLFETIDEIIKSQIETDLTVRDLQESLRNLREKSRTAMEEQGVNILYLTFGLLQWRENNNTRVYYNAPIILVPVSISRDSITSPYILNLHEDEIVLNPTLKYKLQSEFGITLPEFETEQGIEEYLASIRSMVILNRWDVLNESWLTLLSFLKINMYNDLIKNKERVLANENIQLIGGDTSKTRGFSEELLNFDFDKELKSVDTFQVVDADSSQQDAILTARKGYSFILQGPPGTGKSQTITNIIAESLAAGKKVLFVSEKMAALDVVYKRLSASRLKEFCLVLHSHKANKKEMLSQLDEVLTLARDRTSIAKEAYKKLDMLEFNKDKLNNYTRELHTNIEPINKTIFEVNGILSELEEYEEIIFSINNIKEINQERYNEYEYSLYEFTKTMDKMTGDYKENPWNGVKGRELTNELRHDISGKLTLLIPKLEILKSCMEDILSETHLKEEVTYNNLNKIKNIFESLKESPLVIKSWLEKENLEELLEEIKIIEKVQEKFQELKLELKEKYLRLTSLIDLDPIDTLIEEDKIILEEEKLKTHLNENEIFYNIENLAEKEKFFLSYEKLRSRLKVVESKKRRLENEFEKEIFEIDYKGILYRYKVEYSGIFKIFKKGYKEDQNLLRSCFKKITSKISDERAVEVLNDLKLIEETRKELEEENGQIKNIFGKLFYGKDTDFEKLDIEIENYKNIKKAENLLKEMKKKTLEIHEKEDALKKNYGLLYKGFNTNWKEIETSLKWCENFKKEIKNYNLNEEFLNEICNNEKNVFYKSSVEKIIEIKENIDKEFLWFLDLFEHEEKFKNLEISNLIEEVTKCKEGLFLLEEMLDYKFAKKSCCENGLKDYMDKIESLNIEKNNILPIFKKRFFRLWLDEVLPDYPLVLKFRRKKQEDTISNFINLDKEQMVVARERIRSNLINSLPSLNHYTSGTDEVNILRRELNKQRKIMPIRKLFRTIPNLLLELKPCLMMSPLSVSLFLEADTYLFDTIIFDEASQVCTENAIGAISRGKQVIIAGDSKQLPPTNFFGASISDADYDEDLEEDNDDGAFESVLEEASLLPERTLKWHYRSRHEHLIAFSNSKIYKDNLVTFPSNVDKGEDSGVEYIYVENGIYDKGGKKGNKEEAEKVANLVFEHFKKHPNRSLGVIAFGTVQQQAIDMAIRKIRIKNQEFERFFNEELNEAFFIKNLENVQGDERDTIIFSIGYAKDMRGILKMNFGPLSKTGGERRLNVAITRAKQNIKLVGSILPTDINLESINTEGPKLLRSYIDFALNGVSALNKEKNQDTEIISIDSFEASICKFLKNKGYEVERKIGCSEYKIDLGVKHPTKEGHYILGIECDGINYSQVRTARERDRLRQEVLQQMGWKIYKIWSTDWIKDPITEGKRLIRAIKESLKFYDTQEEEVIIEIPEEVIKEETIFIKTEEIIEEKKDNSYGIIESVKRKNDIPLPIRKSFLNICRYTEKIINRDYPIHYDLLCKELLPLYDVQKATPKFKKEVEVVLNETREKYIRKDDFFYPINYKNIPISLSSERIINHISLDEIGEVMKIIAEKRIGIAQKELCGETAKAFKFNRLTGKTLERMEGALKELEAEGKVKIVEGKVIVN